MSRLCGDVLASTSMSSKQPRLPLTSAAGGNPLRAVLAAIPEVIAIIDAGGRFREDFTGDSDLLIDPARQLPGRTVEEFFPGETARQIRDAVARTIASGTIGRLSYEFQRGGRRRWFTARVVPFGAADDPCVLWVARDITEARLAENELRATEARLAEVQRIGRIGSWEWNVVTNEIWWSEQTYELFGVQPGTFLPSPGSILPLIAAEDQAQVERRVQEALEGRAAYQAEYRLRSARGAMRILSSQGRVQRDADGRPLRMVGTIHDVTSVRRTEAQSQRSQRLASLGELAAEIAHEINNPICAAWLAVEAAVSIHKQQHPQAAALDECLSTVASAVQRCQSIVQNILQLARREPSRKTECDLNVIADLACKATGSYAEANGAKITLQRARGLNLACVNSTQIEQVLVNLIRNAIQAGGKQVVVETAEDPNRWGLLRVRDDGRGIPQSEVEQIFEPFVSRGDGRSNVGLGLYLAHAIVVEHGGSIEVESEEGIGTTMTVKIPLKNEQNAACLSG